MTTVYSVESLKDRLMADSQAFDQLINTIPAKYYLSEAALESEPVSKYTYGKRKNSADELKKKALLYKKIKFDPSTPNTVAQIENRNKAKSQQSSSDESADSESDTKSGSESDEDDAEVPEPDTEVQTSALGDEERSPSMRTEQPVNIKPFNEINHAELKERLQERIAAQRKLRKADDPKRMQEFKKRREAKKNKKLKTKPKPNKGTSQPLPEKVLVDESLLPKTQTPNVKSAASIKDVGDLTFPKFEFPDSKKKKGPTSAHALLQKTEAENKKLAELQGVDAQKAKTILEKKAWKKALQQASGEKVKDDPKLLKKTIKRHEKKKAKSTKEWQERLNKVEEAKAEKQMKRTQNLQQRIDAKKTKRLGNKAKKLAPRGKGQNPQSPNQRIEHLN